MKTKISCLLFVLAIIFVATIYTSKAESNPESKAEAIFFKAIRTAGRALASGTRKVTAQAAPAVAQTVATQVIISHMEEEERE